jgi:hypothetical protein
MRIILLSFLSCFAFVSQAQQGLEGIIVEKYYVSDEADSLDADENFAVYPLGIGTVTYRVYVDLLPGYKFIQMFGSPEHPLSISTTTSFYNDPNYGFAVYTGTSQNNTKKNTTLIDSYLTVGGVASGLMGVLKTEDTDGSIGNLQGILANTDPSVGAPITGANGVDGLMPGAPILPNTLGVAGALDVFDQTAGSEFLVDNGTIAALGGVEGVTPSNHVLIGQFTTDGVLSFKLNVQIATPVDGESQIYVAENPGPNEIQLESLIYTSPEIVSVKEVTSNVLNNQFVVYPNPSEGIISIRNNAGTFEKCNISIIDMAGKQVLVSNGYVQGAAIDASQLSSGIYTVRIDAANCSEVQRLIIK